MLSMRVILGAVPKRQCLLRKSQRRDPWLAGEPLFASGVGRAVHRSRPTISVASAWQELPEVTLIIVARSASSITEQLPSSSASTPSGSHGSGAGSYPRHAP